MVSIFQELHKKMIQEIKNKIPRNPRNCGIDIIDQAFIETLDAVHNI